MEGNQTSSLEQMRDWNGVKNACMNEAKQGRNMHRICLYVLLKTYESSCP